ncbi:MAG: squalene--hopene cyclase [Anaerolineales bacterium]|nr:squalene--hopene cyclase [Anaerolineales bacterium]
MLNIMPGVTSHVQPFGESATALPSEDSLARLETAIHNAQTYLLARQSQQGYWWGELQADASVTAGYVPLMHFMRGEVDPARRDKVVNYVKSRQNNDGSWSTYTGGPGDLNVSIQAYFALKLAGVSGNEPNMQRASDFIRAKGGVCKSSVFVKTWLALFGQFGWSDLPSIPPEVIFLPNWFYINIYEFASWSRATIMALMLVMALKPVCPIPDSACLDELFVEPNGPRRTYLGRIERLFSWKSFFLLLDRLFKFYEGLPFNPGRARALRAVEQWIVERQEADGSWGGIMLPWIYSLMALKKLGYALDHPVIARGLQGIEDFIVEDKNTLRLQPSQSPVWDTAWAVIALRESGLTRDHPVLRKAGTWLLGQEIRTSGDWLVKNPKVSPGGWAFEFENDQYPDLDDSAVVPLALRRVLLPEEANKAQAINRALDWVLAMQSKDGGWAAFDRDNNKYILTQAPFVDFMSPLDPTCPDVTAHVVELLGELEPESAALERALAYLKRTQQADGSWYGRWGVNYLYGTSMAIAGLRAAGLPEGDAHIRRAVDWLKSVQNPDGGWGESCESYAAPSLRGKGASNASQTAWSLNGLLAAGEIGASAVQAGIDFLLRTQAEDGSWVESAFTATGFPQIFYLRYDLYRVYFPLIALSRYWVGLQDTLHGRAYPEDHLRVNS